MFWRRKKQCVSPTSNGEVNHTDEINGAHEQTMDVLRGSRASLAELIVVLDGIKKQAEEIVHEVDEAQANKKEETHG